MLMMLQRSSFGSRRMLAALACSLLLPSLATAQSQFVGRVSDATGAVLPGVTVDAASPALIEKMKSAVTDGEGRFNIVDLRPGEYTLTFRLEGFSTVLREKVTLPADFSMTINAEMRLGALEETITVSGAAPIVDVTQSQRAQVMDREVIDSLPLGHTVQARAALVPLVLSTPDVGGSQSMDQHNMRVAGTEDNEATVYRRRHDAQQQQL